jgi:hypothetical protein
MTTSIVLRGSAAGTENAHIFVAHERTSFEE